MYQYLICLTRFAGITFSMPYYVEEIPNANSPSRSRSPSPDIHEPREPVTPDKNIDDEEPGKWFNDLGISLGVSLINSQE